MAPLVHNTSIGRPLVPSSGAEPRQGGGRMTVRVRHIAGRKPALATLLAGMVALVGFASACEDKPSDPSPVCSLTIAPATRTFQSDGGTGAIAVTASDSSCAWTSASTASWITVTDGATGTGSGTVNYRVEANAATDARAATVTVGDQTHTVSQQGRPPVSCTYAISPTGATFADGGGPGTFSVTAPDGCSWAATSSAPFVTITAGQGIGNGAVSFNVAENNGADMRTATIGVVDQTYTITQLAEAAVCEYSVSPVDFAPCMPAGTLASTVTAPNSCTWTASVTVPWLTILSGDSGSGTGQITFSFDDNYDAPRDGQVLVRWPTPTLGQNVRVAQAGCIYGVTQTAFVFSSPGGSSSFNVLQQSVPNTCGGALQDRCIWSATTNVPWITITSPMPQIGDNPVLFTVAPNGTGAARTGTITVKDQVVQITQGG
jgi:hypothetical protein